MIVFAKLHAVILGLATDVHCFHKQRGCKQREACLQKQSMCMSTQQFGHNFSNLS